jgi:HPt (histidine-containing phosphotransfer) domain-containing protein
MKLETSNSINLNYLEVTFGGDKKIINKVLKSFMSNTPEFITELADNVTTGNWNNVRMIAHKIKSSFNTIGAIKVGDVLSRIELDSSEENKSNIYLLVNQVKELSQKVFSDINIELNK